MNQKYKIGYLDEEESWQTNAYDALTDDEFEVEMIDVPIRLDEIWNVIQSNGIDAIIVDFRLNQSGLVHYNGNNVVSEIMKHNEHFPMFIMTSYQEDVIANCENVMIIRGKEIIGDKKDEELPVFKKILKASIDSYKKKIENANSTKLNLGRKSVLSNEEEEMLFKAERFLYEINKDSGIRENMLSRVYSTKLVEMCNKADEILTVLTKSK